LNEKKKKDVNLLYTQCSMIFNGLKEEARDGEIEKMREELEIKKKIYFQNRIAMLKNLVNLRNDQKS
jgi:hypothetical protein